MIPPEAEPIQEELFPDFTTEPIKGRDELNLAEFPITTVGSRANPDDKTITFEDQTFDKALGQLITRRLTVTGSDKFGLPTATDDEVLMGMIQLSYRQGFKSRDVIFKPLDLLRILGWGEYGDNYARLRLSLKRWLGVSLYYDNAWRDKETGEWIDADFHFIENVEIYKKGAKSSLAPQGFSMFTWNKIVFKSFADGNIKALDFRLLQGLETGIAKRMFRFLDKRFYHQAKWTFDLDVFAYEKIGLTRGADNNVAQIKRSLRRAILELEKTSFILPLPEKERYTKIRSGEWEIHFQKAGTESAGRNVEDSPTPLEEKLVACGISQVRARSMIQDEGLENIERQLDHLEFLVAANKGPANQAGWMVKAIANNYSPPPGFKSRADREREGLEKVARTKAREARRNILTSSTKAAGEADELRVQAYLENLSPAEKAELKEAAIKASPFAASSRLGVHAKQAIIANFVLDKLNAEGESSLAN